VKVEFLPEQTAARVRTVPLTYPVIVDGAKISEVTCRRPTMREWRAYSRACADAVSEFGEGSDDLVDQVWLSIPAVVLESLDFVDGTRVETAMQSFFGESSLSPQPEEPLP